jgi:hypothetical protein
MNQKERTEYAQLTIRQYTRLERKYVRRVHEALRITVTDFIEDMNARGIPAATSRLYTVVGNEELANVISDMHVESGLFFGRKAWREINKSVRAQQKAGFGLNEKWMRDIINFFLQDLLSMVSNITDTTREQILAVLAEAQQNGYGNQWIVDKLESPQLTAVRARLIARTELTKGAFAGRKIAQMDSEWETEKEWIAANDHRTRHSHRMVDGEMIDTDARFQVSTPKGGADMMEGPGDPTASAANLCNCRCSSAVRAKRDANGRLIPKQRLMAA